MDMMTARKDVLHKNETCGDYDDIGYVCIMAGASTLVLVVKYNKYRSLE